MRTLTDMMNIVSAIIDNRKRSVNNQRMDSIHSEINASFNNAVIKGVGFLKVNSDGTVQSVDPEEVIIMPKVFIEDAK